MSTVILKDNEYTNLAEQEAHVSFQQRLRKIALCWFTSQSSLQSHWRRFKTISNGYPVSYRVWSRHGAYLEMNGQ